MQAFTVFKNRKEEFLFTINAALPCIIGINSKEASWPEKWLYAWLHCWPCGMTIDLFFVNRFWRIFLLSIPSECPYFLEVKPLIKFRLILKGKGKHWYRMQSLIKGIIVYMNTVPVRKHLTKTKKYPINQ